MSGDVLAKDLRDRRLPVLALGAFLFVMAMFALGLYSGLQATFDNLTKDLPKELLAFVGGDAPGGYVLGELFDLIAPLAVVGYAVSVGSSTIAGEEERKTMGLLVAQPVSRSSILVAKAAAMGTTVTVVSALFWLGATLAATVYDIGVDRGGLAAACLHLALLGITFGIVALAVGSVTGRAAMSGAIVGVLALASYLADSMLPLASLDGWARISPWYYYAGSDPLRNGVDLGHLAVLALIAAAGLIVAVRGFVRRDLRG